MLLGLPIDLSSSGSYLDPGEAMVCRVLPDACSLADINNSGFLSFADASAYLALFTQGSIELDFDDSGAVDFADVSAFIALFAQGCP